MEPTEATVGPKAWRRSRYMRSRDTRTTIAYELKMVWGRGWCMHAMTQSGVSSEEAAQGVMRLARGCGWIARAGSNDTCTIMARRNKKVGG